MVHVTGTSSILAVAALVAVAVNPVEAVAFHCPGINYNIRAGPDWAAAEDKCKPDSQITRELEILKSYTNVLRLYSLTDCDQATTVVPAAIEAGFQLELGLWVDSYNTSYAAEREAFTMLLSTGIVHSGNIKGIHVGSEAIYRGDVDYDTSVSHLNEIRQMCTDNGGAADIPLTITDVGNTYLEYPSLIDEVDYLSVNLFPFWDRVVPAKAASHFLSTYTRLVDLAAKYGGDKKVVIGETGWATNGSDARASEATPENSARYFHDFYQQAQEQNITYYYFSALDESWKGTDTVEAYFGLLYEDGEMKPTIAELELDDEVAASTAGSISASASAGSTEEDIIATVSTADTVSASASEETDASLSAVNLALEAADEFVAGESTTSTVTDTSGEAPASDETATTTTLAEEASDSIVTDSETEGSAVVTSVANKHCAMI
ncbi:glycoside hydrolase 3 protein [Phytophthora oleae]|uniref:glucan endo-1,3-beta-D-glucosidase n=1 Tax=Phytophthora oleae TaxID=2107226 RepID=A0ABD3F4T7_9STRA